MPECDQCGAHVSPDYWRVFAVDGELHGCLSCDGVNVNHVPDA